MFAPGHKNCIWRIQNFHWHFERVNRTVRLKRYSASARLFTRGHKNQEGNGEIE
jgi:hypothetical protein